MKIEVHNTKLTLLPGSQDEVKAIKAFKEATAYRVKDANFNPQFLLGVWDGKRRMVRKIGGRNGHEFQPWFCPVGFLERALMAFDEPDLVDLRRMPGARLPIELSTDVIPHLRPYQREAVDLAVQDLGLCTGKGMLRLPTRSGKTVIAAAIIAELQYRTLFIVQSSLLLHQTLEFFRAALRLTTRHGKFVRKWEKQLIGCFGGTKRDIGWITVATVQSLVCHWETKQVQRELLGSQDVVFFDECHHLEAETWRRAMNKADAVYKIGMSATIRLDDRKGIPESTIRLVSATGPIIYSINTKKLIDEGWLCPALITFLEAPEPEEGVSDFDTYPQQYKQGITDNIRRNEKIPETLLPHILEGERCLVTATYLKHVDNIKAAFERRGLSVAVIVGKTSHKKRKELLKKFRDKELDVLVGTVFGEGVDLPWLDVVFVSDSMASATLTIQRLRNLTPYDPETGRARITPMQKPVWAVVYEFADLCTKILARHTQKRLKTYKEHPAFKVRWLREK